MAISRNLAIQNYISVTMAHVRHGLTPNPPSALTHERMEMKTMFNIETEVKKLTEAYCIEHNLPIKRQFTHEELEESIQRIREAAGMLDSIEISDLSPHCHVSDAEEAEE